MKFKSLMKLTKGHLWGYVILIVLTILHRFTYSYVPLFTQYIIRAIYKGASIRPNVQDEPTRVCFGIFLILVKPS